MRDQQQPVEPPYYIQRMMPMQGQIIVHSPNQVAAVMPIQHIPTPQPIIVNSVPIRQVSAAAIHHDSISFALDSERPKMIACQWSLCQIL